MAYKGRRQREVQYSFPMLKRDNILEVLNGLQIECSAQDLKEPKPAFVRMVFENLAELCMPITKEEMNQPKFEGLDALQ